MNKKIQILSVSLLTLLSSCVKDDVSPYFARTLGEVNEYLTGISDFSGVCINETETGLYGISNAGLLYNIGFDGTVLGTVPFTSTHDFEGVTVDKSTGTIYLCEEAEMAIYTVNADKKGVTKIADIPVENGVPNKGLEGVAFGNGNLYIANQAEPTVVFTYSLSSKKVVSQMTVTFASFLSDLYFDESNSTLWAVDSEKFLATNFTTDGEVIATYKVDFVVKPEGICVDYTRGVVWFSCDGSGRLYSAKINF
ncbi:MAG: SdiA-regulated domain-containing protein [Tidjanibacter sp.]|nr:SdiA-regulated domain-containing protein [Tidjanibacter sp.]